MSDIAERLTEYFLRGGLYNPKLMQHEKVRNLLIDCRAEIVLLRDENRRVAKAACTDAAAALDETLELKAEIARLKETNSQWISDSAETDTVVRDEARKVLVPMDVDGDSYAVPSIEDIVESLVSEIARLRGDAEIARLRLEAAKGDVKRLRLTDEEREAVEVAVESYEEWLSDCGMETMRDSKQRVATLRKLLERLK